MRSLALPIVPSDAAGARLAGTTTRAVVAIALVGVAIHVGFAFVGLGADSFWVDELFTAWVIDTQSLGETIHRIWSDVHPPLYYLSAYGWTQVFGLGEIALRSLSALLAAGSIVILLFGFRNSFSLPARSIGAAAAVTSTYWFEHSQNGRMYALGALLGLVFIKATLDAIASSRAGGMTKRTQTVLALSAFAYAFTHFYMFLAVEVALVLAWPTMRTRRDRLFVALLVIVVAASMGAFMISLLERTAVDVNDTWFSNEPWRLRQAIAQGLLHKGLRDDLEIALACVGLATLVYGTVRRTVSDGLIPVCFCVAVPLGVVISGLVASFVIAPSLSDRNVAIVSPFLWVLCVAIVDLALRTLPATAAAFSCLALIGSIMLNGFGFERRFLPKREDFRTMSSYALAEEPCKDKPIIVLVHQRRSSPFDMKSPGVYARSYYLRDGISRLRFVPIRHNDRGPIPPPVRDIVADRLAGTDPCRIVGLLAHVGPAARADVQFAYEAAGLRFDKIVSKEIRHYAMSGGDVPKSVGAIIFMVRPQVQ